MFTLIPSAFFDPNTASQALSQVSVLKEGIEVHYKDIPEYNAVLVYDSDGDSYLISELLHRLPECPEYNKILCAIQNDTLFISIAQGKSLLLVNSYSAADFTTAQYYIFLATKSLQINPEVSTICFLTPITSEDEMSLYRYFKSVVSL